MSSTINTDPMIHQVNVEAEEVVHPHVPNVEQEPTAEDNYTIEDQRKMIEEGNDLHSKVITPVVYASVAAFQTNMLTANGEKVKAKTWNALPKAEKEYFFGQVRFVAANYPFLNVGEYHKLRFESLAKEGWKHGEVLDSEAKTHPEYVEKYEDAPEYYRIWLNLVINVTYSLIYGQYGENYPYSFALFNMQAQKANEVNAQIHDALKQKENAGDSEGTEAEPSYVSQ